MVAGDKSSGVGHIRTRRTFFLFAFGLAVITASALSGCGGISDSSEPGGGRIEKIVFRSEDVGYDGINTINPDGTGRRLVFRTDASTPTFSPDGSKIAFLSNREDCGGVGCSLIDANGNFSYTSGKPYPRQVWLINADGSGLRQLTRLQEFGASGMVMFSRDGSKVCYTTGERKIHAIDLDSGNDAILNQKYVESFAFSPDGSKILFTSADRSGIYVMNVDGSGKTRLTDSNDPVYDFTPSFSPDGKRIVFSRIEFNSYYPVIYVMNADGTGQTRLTKNDASDYFPSFSPDGRRIVFVSSRIIRTNLEDANRSVSHIYVMNADGTDQRPLFPGEREHRTSSLMITFYPIACGHELPHRD